MVVSWRNKTISVVKDVKKWFFCPVILLCVGMSNFMLSSLHYSDFHAQVQHRLLSITILACLIFSTKSNKSGSMNLFKKNILYILNKGSLWFLWFIFFVRTYLGISGNGSHAQQALHYFMASRWIKLLKAFILT